VVSGIGAIVSTVAVVLGYLWSIGFIQLMFSFLAGSFSTYLIQHRLQVESEKRRIYREHEILMRDTVYGPLFQAMNQILERLEDIRRPDEGTYDKNPMKGIEKVMEHYLFRLSENELRNEVSQIYDDLVEYRDALQRAERAVYDIAVPKLREAYGSYISSTDPRSVFFTLSDHQMTIKSIGFISAILKRVNPLKLFQEAGADLESPAIEVLFRGSNVQLTKKIDEVFTEIEHSAWKENRLLEHEERRKRLADALKMTIPKLERKIIA